MMTTTRNGNRREFSAARTSYDKTMSPSKVELDSLFSISSMWQDNLSRVGKSSPPVNDAISGVKTILQDISHSLSQLVSDDKSSEDIFEFSRISATSYQYKNAIILASGKLVFEQR